MNQVLTPNLRFSDALEWNKMREHAQHFRFFPGENAKVETAWRRGGDSNPRDPFESTRVPGVRLKPGSATSPRANAIMHHALGRSHRGLRYTVRHPPGTDENVELNGPP